MNAISPFYGGFFLSPVPLHLTGNWCSHNCAYCFSNLNRPNRKLNYDATVKFLEKFFKQSNLAARLLKDKYPVLVSNHVDPFSNSNHRYLVPIMRKLTSLGIPVAIQTRGGKESAIADILEFLKPSVWYISICQSDDAIRKKIEPAAPDLHSRYQLIEKVCDKGHRVVIGLNPCVPEWSPDPRLLLSRAKAAGAEGVWLETLHLNYKQRDAMSDWARQAIGESLIKEGMKRFCSEKHLDHFQNCRTIALELGLEIYSYGQAIRSKFFQPFYDLYPKTFPSTQQFINFCHDNTVDCFGFKQWRDFFLSRLPKYEKLADIRHYIFQGVQKVQVKDLNIPTRLDYEELLKQCWRSPKIKAGNPIHAHPFAYRGEGTPEQYEIVQSDGLPEFAFVPQGFDFEVAIINDRTRNPRQNQL